MTPETRLLKYVNVEPQSRCWEWTGARNTKGYGWFWYNGGPKGAHRVAYELFVGPVPVGLLVCHTCDNPGCVNPAHLFTGTVKQNRDDMVIKGRERIVSGELCGNSKLSPAQVLKIRRLFKRRTQTEIARLFKVSLSAVNQIVHRRTWRHL